MENNKVIRAIIEDLVLDITDRRGLKNCWYTIDEDVQEEIKESWYKIIKTNLENANL